MLAERAKEGTRFNETAQGWITEYNLMIGEAKSIFASDPFIQALQPLKYSGNNEHAAGAVVSAARKLQLTMGVELVQQ